MDTPGIPLDELTHWHELPRIISQLEQDGFGAFQFYEKEMIRIAAHLNADDDLSLYWSEQSREMLSNVRSLGGRGKYIDQPGYYRSPVLDDLQSRHGYNDIPNLTERTFYKWASRLPTPEMQAFYNPIEDFKDAEHARHFNGECLKSLKKAEISGFLKSLASQEGFEKSATPVSKDDAPRTCYVRVSANGRRLFSIATDPEKASENGRHVPLMFWITPLNSDPIPQLGSYGIGEIIPPLIAYMRVSKIRDYLTDPAPDNVKSFMMGMKAAVRGYRRLADSF